MFFSKKCNYVEMRRHGGACVRDMRARLCLSAYGARGARLCFAYAALLPAAWYFISTVVEHSLANEGERDAEIIEERAIG